MSRRHLLPLLLPLLLPALAARADVKLPAIFTDHMVLQEGKPLPFWGQAAPQEEVAVTIRGQTVRATAAPDGAWRLLFPALTGIEGPFEVMVAGRQTITLKDVLLGDVWIASGQSNMEWPLAGARDGYREVNAADHPTLRLFQVARPEVLTAGPTDVVGRWERSAPASAGPFSAVGYFFGRELTRTLGRPIGIINSSWGGTPAEAWTPREALAALPPLRARLGAALTPPRDAAALAAQYRQALAQARRESKPLDTGNEGVGRGFADPKLDDHDWSPMLLPGWWEDKGLDVDGAVWFRRRIHLPPSFRGQTLMLRLGLVNNCDTSYVEGQEVGHTCDDNSPRPENWPRFYPVPATLTRGETILVAVRVFDRHAEGGFPSPADELVLSIKGRPDDDVVPLAGTWRYKVERALPPDAERAAIDPPRPAGLPGAGSPGALYDNMLAPLVPFAIRGVIWYQGEANAPRAHEYRTLFPALIRAWRHELGQGDFPFLFVQLANYRPRWPGPGHRNDDEWAELRDAQRLALREPATAMAVTIDIGESHDIHPKNKQEVGRRLALAALAKVYGKEVPYSGPVFKSAVREGGSLRVRFEPGNGLRAAKPGEPLIGFWVAGADRQFVTAQARIDGDTLLVSAPGVTRPVAVRYAWSDDPAANLVNAAGLPASPFRSDAWPLFTARKR